MKWRQFIEDYWELVKKNELMALGGQVSYYLLLSLFPLLIFFFTIAGFADLSSEKIFSELKYLIPVEALQIVENIVYEIFSAHSPTLLSFGMLGTVWASMNGIKALLRGMRKAYGILEKQGFFRLILSSLIVLFTITITLIITLIITLLIHIGEYFSFLRAILALIVLYLFLVFATVIFNRLATNTKYALHLILPGSLFSSAGWLLLSFGFSLYFRFFNTYSLVYGSLAGIIILLLWLYWSCEILLLGCALNSVLIKNYNSEKSKVAK
ncbi:MAG: YihY/virulence factor BrkB family protein [Peptococcaceae bacterium]|nr:YihY/virulence factor BrkB family protein [Peptococcaceae bacterium]